MTLILYDVPYAPKLRRNLLSIFVLTGFGFCFSIYTIPLIYLDLVLYDSADNMGGFIY